MIRMILDISYKTSRLKRNNTKILKNCNLRLKTSIIKVKSRHSQMKGNVKNSQQTYFKRIKEELQKEGK